MIIAGALVVRKSGTVAASVNIRWADRKTSPAARSHFSSSESTLTIDLQDWKLHKTACVPAGLIYELVGANDFAKEAGEFRP